MVQSVTQKKNLRGEPHLKKFLISLLCVCCGNCNFKFSGELLVAQDTQSVAHDKTQLNPHDRGTNLELKFTQKTFD